MMQLASRNMKPAGLCVCKRLYSSTPQAINQLEEFTEIDQMLRPIQKKELSVLSFHKKHFRKSRFEDYENVGDSKNTNLFIRGDPVPNKNDMNFKFALTSKNSSPLPSREVFGDKAVAQAKENSQSAKWYNKAMYDTGSAAQVEELFELASKAGVVDNKLISTYIYNLARRNGQQKAIEKYESVKEKADNEIHASGAAAYAKAMNGPKALEIFSSLQKSQGIAQVPTRVYSAMMNFYFDNGETSKGIELFNQFEKAGGVVDVRMLTSLMRGNRHNKSLAQTQKIFDSIKQRGLSPDKDSFSELIIAYSKSSSKDIPVMMNKIEEMKNAGFRVPYYVYSAAIRAMLANNEYSNSLMTLDTQYREGALPLDKNIVVILARHFSKEERGMRVRPKTQYTIWVAKQAGLYAKDLTYLTTQHVDFMDEYYFRHHPEYDYPDALKKSYQFKSFDEFGLYFPDLDRNPFARRPTPPAAPKSDEDLLRNLPDHLDLNVVAVGDLDIDTAFEYKFPKKAEEQILEYDAHVSSLWSQRTALDKAKKEQEKAAKEAIAAIEKAALDKAKAEAEAEAKKAEGEAVKADEAAKTEGESAKADEAVKTEGEAVKTETATEPAASTAEIKKAEEKAMEAEEKAAAAKEEAVKAEERAEEARIKAKQKELEEAELKEVADSRAEMAEAKAEKAEKEAEKAQAKADEAEKEADLATVKELKAEGSIKEDDKSGEVKRPEASSLRDEEGDEMRKDDSFKEEGGDKAIVEDEFANSYQAHNRKIISGYTKRPNDSILEEEKRMPEFVRKELIQQARIERLIELINSPNRLPPVLPHYLIIGLDAQRLKMFVDACTKTLDDLSKEQDNIIRPAVDLYLVQEYVKGYKKQAQNEHKIKVKGLSEVYRPLDLETKRDDLKGSPLMEETMAVLSKFVSTPPADTFVIDPVDTEDAIDSELEALEQEEIEREKEKSPEEKKSWELVNDGNKDNITK